MGYNGFAAGVEDSEEHYNDRAFKLDNVLHCEENAIISARCDLRGTTIYLTGAGCSSCTAKVIQAGIKRVVIPCKEEDAFAFRPKLDWDKKFEHARRQMRQANVHLDVLEPTGFDATLLMGPEHPFKKKI
jgi:deoxycytidylate deaminase